jgi:hypothetical protein
MFKDNLEKCGNIRINIRTVINKCKIITMISATKERLLVP